MAKTKEAPEKEIKSTAPKAMDLAQEALSVDKDKWVRKARLYKLAHPHDKSPFVRLQAEDRPGRGNKRLLYFDEKTGSQKAIRYCVNQDSPFVDDQAGIIAREHIVFQNGMLVVPPENIALQKFLDVHPWNEKYGGNSGPITFYEHDPEKVAKEEVDLIKLEAEAMKIALELDLATSEAVLRPHVGANLHEMKSDRITRELLIYAKKNPQEFINATENDKLLFENVAYTAVDFSIMTISDNGTVARWASNNKPIVSIPFGQNPYRFLGEWFSTDEGLEVMNKITQLLNKK